MKTGNKILLGAIGFCLLLGLLVMIFVRTNLTEFRMEEDTSEHQTQIIATDDFSKVRIEHTADVVLMQGDKKLELQGGVNSLDETESIVENGTLIIRRKTDEGSVGYRTKIRVYITVDSLTEITHTGEGSLEAGSVLTYPKWGIVSTGVAHTKLDTDSETFYYHQSGAGSAELGGKTGYADFMNSGVGNINAENLEAGKVIVNGSGAGNFQVNAQEELDINLSGVGNVDYRGNPRIRQNISGVGNVNAI